MSLRQSGELEAGGNLAVYAADVRQQVSFQVVPKGYQWAEQTISTVLSLGYSGHAAGVSGPQQLPSTLHVRNHNTKVPLKVCPTKPQTVGCVIKFQYLIAWSSIPRDC